ncbi:MAG: arylsulfatase [Phycisphaerae bacterium]
MTTPSQDATPADAGPNGRPNFLLILADDMGFSDLGCYGSTVRTPNLDDLAGRGVRFTQMYNCARCCPTRASLMTGLYPHQAGIGDMVSDKGIGPAYQGYLRQDTATIAEVLADAGYRTLHTGKWHAGGFWSRVDTETWRIGQPTHPLPVDRGFDEFYGLPGGGSYFYPNPLMRGHDIIDVPEGFYTTDNYTDEMVKMIRRSVAEGEPFFAHVCYNAPHWPLHAWEEDIERYRGQFRNGWDAHRTARHEELKGMGILSDKWDISPRDEHAPLWEDAPHHDWEDARMATYAAMVDRLDQGVGRLLATLDELGVADNTVVMFLSDNGGSAEFLKENGRAEAELKTTRDGRSVKVGNVPGLEPGGPQTFMSYDVQWSNVSNSPFRLHKHWVHEGGISTPFILHWPAGLQGQGRIEHTPAHIIDIVATCLDLAGAEYPDEHHGRPVQPLEGESFAPLLRGQPWQRQQPICWEHEGNRAVRMGEWKLVSQWEKGGWELYDMNEDRTELHDLATVNAAKAADLEKVYEDWAHRVGVIPWRQVIARR